MYPSSESPNFGIFVKNFEQDFPKDDIQITERTIIKGRKNGFSLIIAYLLFFKESLQKLYGGNFDLVYVHYLQHSLIPFHFWKKKRNKKIVLNAHGTDILGQGRLYQLLRKWNISQMKRADLVIAPSNFFIQKLVELGVSNQNILVYPSSGVNQNVFFPAPTKQKATQKLGYLGRIDKGKGVETLIRAFTQVQNDHLILELCGPGDLIPDLSRLVQSLGIQKRVNFLGNIPHEEIRGIMIEWDAMVFPSELEESLGLVGLEAMACGIPVLGTGKGGMSTYLISGHNGIVFKAGNVMNLTEKISHFYDNNQEFRNQLAQNAIATASEYYSERVNSKLRKKIRALFAT